MVLIHTFLPSYAKLPYNVGFRHYYNIANCIMDLMIKYEFTVILSKEKKVLTYLERFSNTYFFDVITVFVRQREPPNLKCMRTMVRFIECV